MSTAIREKVPSHVQAQAGVIPIECELIFDLAAPLEVSMRLRSKTKRYFIKEWTFDRRILLDGQHCTHLRQAGDPWGDVHSWADFTALTQHVLLESPAGRADIVLDWATVGGFLRRVYRAMPDKLVDRLVAASVDELVLSFPGVTL